MCFLGLNGTCFATKDRGLHTETKQKAVQTGSGWWFSVTGEDIVNPNMWPPNVESVFAYKSRMMIRPIDYSTM